MTLSLAILAAGLFGFAGDDPFLPPVYQPGQLAENWQPAPPMPFVSTQPDWSVGLLIGVPLGVRFSRPFERAPVSFEAFAGFTVIFPSLGVGLRTELPMSRDSDNCVLLRPGVDAYLLGNPYHEINRNSVFGVVTGDCDIVLRHRFANRKTSDFGIKLGLGVPVTSRGGLFPVIGLFGGFDF